MRLFFLSVLLFCLSMGTKAVSFRQDSMERRPDKSILMINSYHPRTKWSEDFSQKLKVALSEEMPGVRIYSGNMNAEEAATDGSIQITFRGIIWQMAEQAGDTINPESLSGYSFYRIKKTPDLLVFIGEEAYLKHRELHISQGKWSNIPIVCCALNDSASSTGWTPGVVPDFTNLQDITNRNIWSIHQVYTDTAIEAKDKKEAKEVGLEFEDRYIGVDSAGHSIYYTQYHATGVSMYIPVRENLELLKQLMPKLKEVVWVDYNSYKSNYALYKLKNELPKILPNVKLTILYQNNINTDSLFDAMLTPVKQRVFMSYAWYVSGESSHRSEEDIRDLFERRLKSPFISLTEQNWNNNYYLGGVQVSPNSLVLPTVDRISRILNGECADSISFVQVENMSTNLNVPALRRLGLSGRAEQIEQVNYQNIPLPFYQRYERIILVSILIFFILSGSFVLIARRLSYTRKIQKEYVNYHKLYKRLQVIYQNSDIDFALYNRQGDVLTRIIAGQEQLEGRREEILAGNLFSASWLPEKAREMIKKDVTVNENVTLDDYDAPYPMEKEKKKWNLIIRPLPDQLEQEARYIGIAIDLTPLIRERKTKERSEHIFQFATEAAKVGVAAYDMLTGKGFASSNWYSNLNEPRVKDVLPTYENVCEEDRQALLAYRKRVIEEGVTTPFIQTIEMMDEQGEKHYILEYIFLRKFIPEKQIISVVELNLNYDEPKRKEYELEQVREKAELSNLETEQFLANISHEIRTPLNAIVGFSTILASSTDEDEVSTLAPVIEQNNKLLTELIDNILHLSKLDSGTVVFNYVATDINSLFDSLVGYGQELVSDKQVAIVKEVPDGILNAHIAENEILIVMQNLISNAVKFTMRGEIVLGYEKRETEYYFYVRDSGCGISPEQQECIFKRFSKLDSFTQGTGLGLSLCRSIVVHHGGEIGIKSAPGGGSCFWFTLPKNLEEA